MQNIFYYVRMINNFTPARENYYILVFFIKIITAVKLNGIPKYFFHFLVICDLKNRELILLSTADIVQKW